MVCIGLKREAFCCSIVFSFMHYTFILYVISSKSIFVFERQMYLEMAGFHQTRSGEFLVLSLYSTELPKLEQASKLELGNKDEHTTCRSFIFQSHIYLEPSSQLPTIDPWFRKYRELEDEGFLFSLGIGRMLLTQNSVKYRNPWGPNERPFAIGLGPNKYPCDFFRCDLHPKV